MEDPRQYLANMRASVDKVLERTVEMLDAAALDGGATLTRIIDDEVVVTRLSPDEVYLARDQVVEHHDGAEFTFTHLMSADDVEKRWPSPRPQDIPPVVHEIWDKRARPAFFAIDPSAPDGDVSAAVVMSHDPDGVMRFRDLPRLSIEEAPKVVVVATPKPAEPTRKDIKVGTRFRDAAGRRMIVEKVNDDETVQARCLDNRKQRRAQAAKRRKG